MSGHEIYTIIAVIFIIVGFVLLGFGIYYAYEKEILTTGDKWLYWGGGFASIIVALILFAVAARKRVR